LRPFSFAAQARKRACASANLVQNQLIRESERALSRASTKVAILQVVFLCEAQKNIFCG
jgi:hypothetical protein